MITWKITNCETVDKVSGVEDKGRIVANVYYKVEDEFGVLDEGVIKLPTTDFSNFTPWEQLTEQQIINWVKAILGDKVQEIENKTNNRGLPWA
jgi:hypothetical protein